MADLYEKLKEYSASDYYPFHMPGHKRRRVLIHDPYEIDITEIYGFDDLHHPGGILKEAQERAAVLYGAAESFFLVNGSTGGVLSSIGAACARKRSSSFIIARNSHRSAYHALYLNKVQAEYLWPDLLTGQDKGISGSRDTQAVEISCPIGTQTEGISGSRDTQAVEISGPIDARAVEEVCAAHPDAAGVFLTSPTYEGVVSDIASIARITHRYGIPLIVDEAHGAHFGLHPDLPRSAVSAGADIVIQSLHKTLYSMTQTALLHIGRGSLIDPSLIRRMLRIYQTSSPSYVLMASLDECIGRMQEHGREDLEEHLQKLKRFRSSVDDLRELTLIDTDDPSRILIASGKSRLSGKGICDILRNRYHLEAEMGTPGYALMLTSPGDDEEGLVRLSQAVLEMDRELFLCKEFPSRKKPDWLENALTSRKEIPVQQSVDSFPDERTGSCPVTVSMFRPECVMPIDQAWDQQGMALPIEKTEGMISCEFVYLYPPGIPLLTPGERVPEGMPAYLGRLRGSGHELQGMDDETGNLLRVLDDTGKGE